MEPLAGVEFGPVNAVEELRLLNETTFPVRYNEKFYAEVLATRPEHTKYAYWRGRVVGAICCRLEPHDVPGQQRLYIMTLGVQAAYRGRGIGSRLLESVLEATRSGNKEALSTPPPPPPTTPSSTAVTVAAAEGEGEHQAAAAPAGPPLVAEVYLHVQTSNADALAFYKKFRFENRGVIRNYYKRIEPPDCYVLALPLLDAEQRARQQHPQPQQQQPQPQRAAVAAPGGALVA